MTSISLPTMPSDSLEIGRLEIGIPEVQSASTWYFSPMAGSLIVGRPYCARAGSDGGQQKQQRPPATAAGAQENKQYAFLFSAPDASNYGWRSYAGSLGGTVGRERSAPNEDAGLCAVPNAACPGAKAGSPE